MANRRKLGLTALKLLVSAALAYFIFEKLDPQQIFGVLKNTQVPYLALALVFFVLSKVLAAFRLNLYFHALHVKLTHQSNLKLYLLGMFYNLFLPGGIGGDAYKGYLIQKKFDVPVKQVVSILVLDRLSGMLLLFIYACFLALFIEHPFFDQIKPLFALGAFLAVLTFFWVNKRYFGYALSVFWPSFGFSALVQLAQLACAWAILKALGVELGSLAYLFIFLISSIISILPITIGGIGTREVTFFYGASVFGLDETLSVGISMVFFLITAAVSLLGMVYHLKKITLTSQNGGLPYRP